MASPVAEQRTNGQHAAPVEPLGVVRRRMLIVEDNDLARSQLQKLLNEPDMEVHAAADGHEAFQKLMQNDYSILITDLRMPHMDGMELIQKVQEQRLPVTIIVTTGHGSIDEAVQAMRLGAYDFLTKPIDLDSLRIKLQRALRDRQLQDEVASLRAELKRRHSFNNILSKNPRMHQIFELIADVGHTNATVLIQGETGTGKEVVARAIHQASHVRNGPMVAINCAALPETLLESELFGHEKGAFTSAVAQRRGRFELANHGTLMLDEVGDIPAPMQAKLLRVLQERRFERVGGTESIEVDVRIIAASNRSLLELVKQGTFREDLYYRLNVVKIELPPLRERPEDIPLLAVHFTEKYARPNEGPKQISPEAMEVLLKYHWPGNIRELENVVERACVTARDSTIMRGNLAPELLAAPPAPASSAMTVDLDKPLPVMLREAVASIEQAYIRKALEKTHGNVGRTAKLCGLSRRSMSAKIGEYGIDKATFKET